MPYPPRYLPQSDFARDAQAGKSVDGSKLSTELANVSEALVQVIDFIRAGFTSDKRWQPATALAQEMVQTETFTPVVDTDTFAIPNGALATADSFVRVFVDGIFIDPDTVTVDLMGQTFTLPTPALAGSTVVGELINDYATLRNDLNSTLNSAGASLVAIEDAIGQYTSVNTEDALAEVMLKLNNLLTTLGDLSKYGLITGTRAWEADQSMGGNQLKDVQDGTAPQDAVTVAQLDALSAVYGDLSTIFLALSGGTMSGTIDMGNNFITTLRAGTQPLHAVNLAQLTELRNYLDTSFMPKAGGTFTGDVIFTGADLNMDGNRIFGLPDAVAATQPITKNQFDVLLAALTSGGYQVVTDAGAGQFAIPPFVTRVSVLLCGGGGGGGGGDAFNDQRISGGGGNVGNQTLYQFNIQPFGDPADVDRTIYVNIGAGGAGGPPEPDFALPQNRAGTGGTTTLTYPDGSVSVSTSGGLGGFSCNQPYWQGGEAGQSRNLLSQGGALIVEPLGISSPGGIGGTWVAGDGTPGLNGIYGSGGGGGGYGGHGIGGAGGGGGHGFVLIWWN